MLDNIEVLVLHKNGIYKEHYCSTYDTDENFIIFGFENKEFIKFPLENFEVEYWSTYWIVVREF
jgi:hypothetical protein